MTFAGLVTHNVWTKKVRSGLTAAAISIGVIVVITLGIVTHSLKTTAAGVLQTGKADFTVADSTGRHSAVRRSSPAASANAWRSRARLPTIRECCSPTNRRDHSTRKPCSRFSR
jgi:hypothetical protein